ncbi:carbohydrate sulfotransferase 14-like [Oppia nitens]|uniref:carbohydrate sulfotransferase 14-like n=1 Tax=Oppia nitens TaxID=1686743 RepID=UPI0023DAE575|nr:carbohydrate sulfotransferase 14-like [Oppia nitens]
MVVTIFIRKSSNYRKGKSRYCTTKSCPLLVNEKHRFMACFVPKIASTSMKNIFNILDDNKINITNINNTEFHIKANDLLTRISPMFYNIKQNKNYYKMLFVRHPFVRLVSAFKDKAERNRSEESYFYDKYWDKIMSKERSHYTNDSKPTFQEFVKLLLTTNEYTYDEHWAPIWTRCEPCYVDYDFIGKLETSAQDFAVISNKLNLSQMFWENKNVNKYRNQVKQYLLQISSQEIIGLYKKYFLDFKLFGYTIEEIFY